MLHVKIRGKDTTKNSFTQIFRLFYLRMSFFFRTFAAVLAQRAKHEAKQLNHKFEIINHK